MPGETLRFLLLSILEVKSKSHADSAVITDAPEFLANESSDALQQRILVLEHSLQSSEESLQSTIEELETSNEELQSTNEELMSTNEELQSTNEELHSVNEELYTVSAEHQRKNEELTERDTDVDMLLQLSKIGTVHLDPDLCLQRYTNKARSIFNIMPQDVGRPFNHITSQILDHDIVEMVNNVQERQEVLETELTVHDESYLLRILPYQREERVSGGVLITIIDITDLQEMRLQLRHLNEQYKDIVENTASFIVRWDADTNEIVYCNDLFAERWNSTVGEIIGRSIIDLRPEREREPFRALYKRMQPGESTRGVYSFVDEDGIKRSAQVTTRAISQDGIKISEFQAIGNDCTEEQNYRDALDSLSLTFSNTDLNPEQKLEKILQIGLDFYQLETALISMIVGNEYKVTTVVGKVLADYTSNSVHVLSDTVCHQFVDTDVSLLVDNLSSSRLKDTTGHKKTGVESYVGAVISTASGPYGSVNFSSLTPRGKAFSLNEENFAALISGSIGFLLGNLEQLEFTESQTEYYKSLFASVPSMLILADTEGLILSASELFANQIGEDNNSIPGRNCLNYFHSEDKNSVGQALKDGRTEGLPARLSHAKTGFLDVELNVTVKSIGTLQGIRMITATDVTSRNRALRDAEEQNKRLESANENLNQFAFIASHDLQEPLRKIQQFSSFLEEDMAETLNDDARFHLNVIVDASQRMSDLIHDLLHYSGTSQSEPEMEELDLGEILHDVIQELGLAIEDAGATVEVNNVYKVSGNKSLLTQLFTNLISNAIKYRSPERSVKIRIEGIGQNNKEGIFVADNGIGFEMSHVKKIFEPFARLHNNKEFKGNGIGLAICTTVCDKHGWTLSAESEMDKGSKFTISFNHDDK